MDLTSGTRFGPYEIVSRIGAGGMGVVYRARDTRLDRDVAIKVLQAQYANDADRLRRFEQEARATSALNHPNILSVFDVGTWEGSSYIVSELLEGTTLRERLRSGPLGGRKGLEFATQVARGLAAAHQKGIVHRDLKPENIFLMKDGRAKILDFGLAKLLEPAANNVADSDTQTGRIIGTAGYMSPEQVRGNSGDQRSDIFSLGAILYETFSGKRAFRAASVVETLNAILTVDPPDLELDNAPAGVEAIIARCLEKDPDNRFQTAQDLAFNLESIRDSSLTSTRVRHIWSPNRARLLVAALILIATLAVLAAVANFARRTVHPPPPATYTRLTFRPGNLSEARFAPDGQTVVYGAAWDGKPMEIFTTRINGPESRHLGLPPGSVFSVSPQGLLAISEGCDMNFGKCHGTLAEVSLAGGAPRQIAEDIDWADWSPDGKDVVVVRALNGRYRLEYPIGHVLFETIGWISNPRFSPDGQFVALVDHPDLDEGGGTIVVVDRSGRRKVLSEGWKLAWGLAWRANDEIWFNGSRTTRTVQLFSVKLDKSERHILSSAGDFEIVDIARPSGGALFFRTNIRARMLFGGEGRERELSWFDASTADDLSADGKLILFSERGDGARGSPQVYIRSTDGADAVRLGSGRSLALSPDKKWALALDNSPRPHLVLLPTGAGDKRLLPPGDIVEIYSATFFPDGGHILIAGEGKDHLPRSWSQDVDGQAPVSVGATGMAATLVSADGKRIAASAADARFYVLPVDGGDPSVIPGTRPGDRLLQWSSDGRTLYVRAAGDDAVDIDKLDIATGRRQPWKHIVPSDPVGMIGVDVQGRVCVSRDGKFYAYSYWQALHDLYYVGGLQ